MSAAEAATPEPGTGHRAGDVIPMSKYRTPEQRDPRRRQRRAGAPMTDEQRLAENVEAVFHAAGLTLTDKKTADVFRVTLGIVQAMLNGARKDDTLAEEPHAILGAMIDGMRNAPGLV